MCDAFGAAKDLVEPTVVDETLRTSWELYPWNFTESVANKFMASWMIGEDHQAGACGEYDEGAGLAIIATDIFDNGNGAEFCTRQIQAANGRSKSWIDFYDTKNYKCNSVCKPGFYG